MTDLIEQLAALRETFCYASPGSDAEFTSLLLGFDTAAKVITEHAAQVAERDRLAAANAVLEAEVAGLRDFVDDFAKAKIDALRYSPPYGSSPEDEPDPVVDAKTVWAWQADAALATQEAGNAG